MQSIILICTIIVVAVGGSLVYVLLNGEATSETIKIGVLADLDTVLGGNNWQGAVLAAEQPKQQGG